jgi:hypothetical protein
MHWLIKLALFFFISGSLHAAIIDSTNDCSGTYYISSTGSDQNDGLSLAAPFKTIQKCAQVVKAGQSCVIRQGIYPETVNPAQSGTAGKEIVFKNYCGEIPVLSGADIIKEVIWVPGKRKNVYETTIKLNPSNDKTFLMSNQVFAIDTSSKAFKATALMEARWPTIDYVTNPLLYPRSSVSTAQLLSKDTEKKTEMWLLTDPSLSH